jgi:hypothetical protein
MKRLRLPFSSMNVSRSFQTPYRKGAPRTIKRSHVGLFFAAILMGVIYLNYSLLTSSSATADMDATLQNIKAQQQQQQQDHAHPKPLGKVHQEHPKTPEKAHSKTPEKAHAKPPEKAKAHPHDSHEKKAPAEKQAKSQHRHGQTTQVLLPPTPVNPLKGTPPHIRKGNNNNDNKSKSPAPGYADGTTRNPYPYRDITAKKSNVAGSPKAVQVLHQPLNDTTATIIPMAQPLQKSKNTMVIAYFRVESKYKPEKYETWMTNIFSLQDCMVVFTQPDMVETVRRLRAHAADRTVIVVQPSPTDLPVSRLYRDTHTHFWEDQLLMDKEAKRHRSFALFWIWLSKSWWVTQAVQRNFFRSDFYMYSDIGCFRSAAWNDKTLLQHTSIVPTDTVMWMAHHQPNPPATRLWNDKFQEKPHFYHSGSQGAGTAEAWQRFHAVFAETMDQFASHGLFIGEDQCILQSACLGSYDSAAVAPMIGSTVGTGVCTYAPFDQVPDNHYFGLRYVLHHGGENYQFWKPPLDIDMA